MEQQFVYDVLALFEKYDSCESVEWRCSEGDVKFYIRCNDVFFWGTSDAEELTADHLPLLKQTVEDVRVLGVCKYDVKAFWTALELFISRVRCERPQGAAYPKERELWPLFDAAGPERSTGLGNPYKPGEYGQSKVTP
jgi:hypothetical protein